MMTKISRRRILTAIPSSASIFLIDEAQPETAKLVEWDDAESEDYDRYNDLCTLADCLDELGREHAAAIVLMAANALMRDLSGPDIIAKSLSDFAMNSP